MLKWRPSDGAPPLYATSRNPDAINEGAEVAIVARSLGTPLLPWQQYVADVATERRDDGSYAYDTVVVSVPRQTGKTTLIRAMGVHRAGVLGRDVHYTAQTGKDARARWDDLRKMVERSPVWKDRAAPTLRGGAEKITFHGRAGFHCFAPVLNCLHGSTPATVVLDEAFAHDDAKGALLMGAISTAHQTILARQVWIVSTAGTADSTFLHDWIDKGLERTPRVALFLWAADDQTNPYTLDGIESYHPGVGFFLGEKVLTAADVLSEVEKNSRAEYERAFANRRTLTSTNLIPAADWRTLGQPDLQPPDDTADVTLSYDVSLDRLSSSILASWIGPEGKPACKVVQSGPGAAWLADAVDKLVDQWRPAGPPVAVGHGPVLEVTADLRNRGLEVEELTEREYATASGAFLTLIDERAMVHPGTDDDQAGADVLEQSVTGLVARPGVVDGVAFSRRHSVGDSSPGIAAVIGLWVAAREDGNRRPMWSFAS